MIGVLKKQIVLSSSVAKFAGVVVFLSLISLGAFVRMPLPFTPVPVTLQTFFVLLSGAFLGAGLGLATQIIYIILGVLGVSLFTNAGAGILYFCGPTTGYLAGFIVASFFIGKMIPRTKNNFINVFALLMAGDLMLLVCGAMWLKLLIGLSLTKALLIGLLPFIPGDVIKAWVAAAVILKLKPGLKKIS